jgi:hypothetical protein
MQIRAAALFALVALVSIGSVLAQTTEPKLSVSGTVVSTGNTSMVVKSDETGQPMSFLMSTTTLVPAGLSVGSRVTVAYHPVGAVGQMADTVMLLDTAPSQSTEPSQSSGPSQSIEESAAQLPTTASLLPLVGLIGLVALLGSISLRVLARRRS